MKYAVVSDIHGDIIALENALNEIDKHNVDKIICLGDFIGIGPCPQECTQKLMSLGDKLICVMGNHEDRVVNEFPKYLHDNKVKVTEKELAHAKWVKSVLTNESIDFIKNLPKELVINDGNKKIAIMHYPSRENQEFYNFIFYPTYDESNRMFSKYGADINLFGHTHVALAKCYDNKYYFNPGSLGLPDYRTYGTFGILNVQDDKIIYDEYDFKFDYDKVLNKMNELNYPQLNTMKELFWGTKY